MAKPYFHAQSSAKKYGGKWEDYMEIHELMDSSKAAFPDNRHRALTHNSWFIGFVLPRVFGETFRRKSDNKIVNTRDIGEQHVLEDYKFKFIPTPQDFLQEMDFLPWMQNGMGDGPTSHKKIDNTKSINDLKILSTPVNEDVLEDKNPCAEIPFPEALKYKPISDEEVTKQINEALEKINKRDSFTKMDRSKYVFDGRRHNYGNDNQSKTID